MDSTKTVDDDPELCTPETDKDGQKLNFVFLKPPARNPICIHGPFLGFEDEDSNTPTQQTSYFLDLDSWFFPEGIKKGDLMEIKGPANSGKTFLLTYFIAQLLRKYPDKKAILIDTSHQFNFQNLISMIFHQHNFKVSANDLLTPSKLVETSPEVTSYLDRLIVLKCNSAEEFFLSAICDKNTLLEQVIKQNRDIGLIAIDTIDCYSTMTPINEESSIEILSRLKTNCAKIPTICTSIKSSLGYQLVDKAKSGGVVPNINQNSKTKKPCFDNISIDTTLFTHSLSIVPAAEMEKKGIQRKDEFKKAHYAKAYLRSKQRANTVESAEIHRVKFSIFSDMLWIIP